MPRSHALRSLAAAGLLILAAPLASAAVEQTKGAFEDKFRQLDEVLPTPNVYRNAAGEPGHAYWQQQADYDIEVTLDEAERTLTGTETVTYRNNSPDTLRPPAPAAEPPSSFKDRRAKLTCNPGCACEGRGRFATEIK